MSLRWMWNFVDQTSRILGRHPIATPKQRQTRNGNVETKHDRASIHSHVARRERSNGSTCNEDGKRKITRSAHPTGSQWRKHSDEFRGESQNHLGFCKQLRHIASMSTATPGSNRTRIGLQNAEDRPALAHTR